MVRKQTSTTPVVGFLNSQSSKTFSHLVSAFRNGLEEAGYVEDRNVRVKYRCAEGRPDELAGLAADLVRRCVDVIVATGGAHAAAKGCNVVSSYCFHQTG